MATLATNQVIAPMFTAGALIDWETKGNVYCQLGLGGIKTPDIKEQDGNRAVVLKTGDTLVFTLAGDLGVTHGDYPQITVYYWGPSDSVKINLGGQQIGVLRASTAPKISRFRNNMANTWNSATDRRTIEVNNTDLAEAYIIGLRVDRKTTNDLDDYGVFSGDSTDTAGRFYSWEGDPWASVSLLTDTGPDPEPDPVEITDALTVTAGEQFTYDAAGRMGAEVSTVVVTSGLPDGCALDAAGRLTGSTPYVGSSVVVFECFRPDDTPVTLRLTLTVADVPTPDPVHLTSALTVTAGKQFTLDLAAAMSVARVTTTDTPPDGVTITATGLTGTPTTEGVTLMVFDGTRADATPVDLTLTLTVDPADGPAPDDTLERLALQVYRWIKRPAPTGAALDTAKDHVQAVLFYAHGYTRGNGFTERDPMRPLIDVETVVIAAAARLVVNPEQMTSYQVGDYSERPAILTGWKLVEMNVLNKYRKRWA